MIECWDDDFAFDTENNNSNLLINSANNNPLNEQLDVVRNFASTVQSIENVLINNIPTDKISLLSEDDTVLKAMDLVAISKQDYTDKFFDTLIGKEYLKRNDQERKERLDFLRGDKNKTDDDDNENDENYENDQVDVDMNTVKRLAQRAGELLPKLQKIVDRLDTDPDT